METPSLTQNRIKPVPKSFVDRAIDQIVKDNYECADGKPFKPSEIVFRPEPVQRLDYELERLITELIFLEVDD